MKPHFLLAGALRGPLLQLLSAFAAIPREFPAVKRISHQGMPDPGHVDPDLVRSPVLDPAFQQCPGISAGSLRSRKYLIEGPRRFMPEVNATEFLPIGNERGNIVGRAMYVELHNGNKMLHPVAHLHVINGEGVTTRRYWWHVAFGDTPEKTLKRKMAEKLGLSGANPKLKRQYIRETKTEKELVYVFTVVSEEDLPFTPDRKEYNEVFERD